MSNHYRIQFSSLADSLSEQQAHSILVSKLKLSEQNATLFLSGKPIFNATTKEKALKQQKTFATLGIHIRIQDLTANESSDVQTRANDVDTRILAALDYITTSIIRLEEKVDDLARQQQELNISDTELPNESSGWGEDLEFEESEPVKNTRKINWIFISLLTVLLTLLAVVLVFPELIQL